MTTEKDFVSIRKFRRNKEQKSAKYSAWAKFGQPFQSFIGKQSHPLTYILSMAIFTPQGRAG